MNEKIFHEFKEQAAFRLNENTPRIQKCLDLLTEEEVWIKPNKVTNSVGNLILHLCGNIRQYMISSLGQQNDERDRDAEFSTTGGLDKEQLYEKLSSTVNEAINTMNQLEPSKALVVKSVQGFDFTPIGIILHVVEHYSYHTGQIAWQTKILKGQDLGFYADLDLNIKNKS